MKLAQLTVPGNNGPVEIQAPEGIPTGGLSSGAGEIIGWIITFALIIAILFAFGFILYGGFLWMTSYGDKAKLETARKTIIFAIVGLIIAFLATFIIALIGAFLDVNLLQIEL